MIDFKNASYLKLRPVSNTDGEDILSEMLIDGEDVFATFKTVRDMVVITNKRIVTINVQGMTGKKKDFTSLPYSKVQAFSIETASVIDLDCELCLWFSSLGMVRFEIAGSFDIRGFNRLLSEYIL